MVFKFKADRGRGLGRASEPTSRFAPDTPLKKEVPFGPTTSAENVEDLDIRVKIEASRDVMTPGQKIRPGKPTQRDRERIIKAKLQKLAGRFDKKPTRIQQVTPFKIEKTKINKFTGKPQKFIQFTSEEAAFIEGDVNKIRPRKQDFPSDLKKRLARIETTRGADRAVKNVLSKQPKTSVFVAYL